MPARSEPSAAAYRPWPPIYDRPIGQFCFDKRFRAVGLGDYRNASFGDQETAGAILLGIVADHRAGGNLHALVDDGAANSRMAADIDPFEHDRIVHFGIAVDPHVGTQNRSPHLPAGNDAAGANDAVERLASAAVGAVFGKHKLRRRRSSADTCGSAIACRTCSTADRPTPDPCWRRNRRPACPRRASRHLACGFRRGKERQTRGANRSPRE